MDVTDGAVRRRSDPHRELAGAADLGSLLGPGLHVDIQIVDDIPLERSGKRPILKTLPAAVRATEEIG